MKRRHLQWMVLATLLCGVVRVGVAAESTDEAVPTYQLNPVIVTAQRTETKDLDTPASTVVLTKEDMQRTGASTIFDALAFTSGVENFSFGAGGRDFGGMGSRINIRGLDRSALVLVNGAPINLNGKNSIDGIIPENVKRVEVVKGAASTLYGAEAIGGVVNIITEQPETSQVYTKLKVGNLGTKGYVVQASSPDVTIGISKDYYGGVSQTSPIRKDLDGKKKYEYYNNTDKGGMLTFNVGARLSDKWQLNFMRSESNSTYGQAVVPGTLKKRGTTEAKESKRFHYEDKKNIATVAYNYNDMTATFFYNDRDLYGETRNLASPTWSANQSNYVARKYGAEAQHKWSWGNGDTFIGGTLISRDTYKSTAPAIEHVAAGRNNFAVYGSYTHNFSDRFSTIVGARLQAVKDPVKDQHVIMPQWQMLYKINDTSSWYTNIGKAFTMPNLSDSYRLTNGEYRAISGPNLKPEEGWNYEIGYKKTTDTDSWKVALFYMDFSNFFDWAPDPTQGNRQVIRINGGQFRNIGLEVDYKRLLSDRLTLNVGSSYSNPKSQAIGVSTWNQTYPKLQVHAGLAYDDGHWSAGTALNWLTKRLKNRDGSTNPDLIDWNAYVGYTFTNNDTVRLQLNNLLDRRNVISNGDWEYWGNPFNYTISYEHRF